MTNRPDRHELMARFITDGFGEFKSLNYEAVLEGCRRDDERLRQTAEDYERVVIWAEHDSYDQLMLIRVLAHYANTKIPRFLELVGVSEFPGSERFIGLGQLPSEALRLLWSSRRTVTPAQLSLGSDAWNALASEDPRHLSVIAQSRTPALPIMAPALQRHLRELPAVENGLSLTQQLILQILSEEKTATFTRIFSVTQKERDPLPYLGDWGLARVVREMEQVSEPPFIRTRESPDAHWYRDRLTITEAGQAVLNGERDWHSSKPLPRWVGGVHICPGVTGWRWNETKQGVDYV